MLLILNKWLIYWKLLHWLHAMFQLGRLYIYLHDIDKKPEFYYDSFILEKFPVIIPMRPSNFTKNTLIGMSIISFEDMIFPWITDKIHNIENLSNICVLNIETLSTEEIFISRDNEENIFHCPDLKRSLCGCFKISRTE